MNYTGTKFSESDKKVIRQMRSLVALGNEAGSEITDKEAGIFDSMLNKMRHYITNNVEGIDGRATYETFRNTFRHMLYGSALSAAEISAFNNAVGTLGQQAGPVLAQLNTQMRDIKSQLLSVYDLNDEYVSYFYLGKTLDEVQQSIDMIDDRVEMISSTGEAKSLTIDDVRKKDPNRPSLDSIFNPRS